MRLAFEGRGNGLPAILALRRRGVSALKAKRAVEAAIEGLPSVVSIPGLDGEAQLSGELAGAGFAVSFGRLEGRTIDIRSLRQRLSLTQEEFAAYFDLDVDAVRNWEHGRRTPDRAARAYLALIDREPLLVADLLRRDG